MRKLTDRQLLARLNGIARLEREAEIALLVALGEVERRRLHVSMGYSTVFDFLRRHLGYSESGAARRLRVARCFRSYPELVPMYRRREVSMSTVMAISGVLNPANRETLIAAVKGKSRREVDVLVAKEQEPVRVVDSIRPAFVRRMTDRRSHSRAETAVPAPAVESIAASSRAKSPELDDHDAVAQAEPSPAKEMRVVRFAACPEFEAKIERARSILSRRVPSGPGLAQVLDAALDAFLEKHDPEKRRARREKRRNERQRRERDRRTTSSREDGRRTAPASATIPAATRDEVFVRDGGRCTFWGRNGVQCRSRHNLQIDHIRPRALGGGSTADNLRVLCATHNRHLAKEMLPTSAAGTPTPDR